MAPGKILVIKDRVILHLLFDLGPPPFIPPSSFYFFLLSLVIYKILIGIIHCQKNQRQHDGSKQASKNPWKSAPGNVLRGSSKTEEKLTLKYIKESLGQGFSTCGL